MFGVFAAGFLMRPVGAAIFGHFGDRIGRKRTLAASVLLMAIPTALIGLLPTYAQVGVLAPILLTVMRLLQGLSVGGEYSGSILFLVEHAPPGKRGFFGSWSPFSATVGILLGSGAGALLTSYFSQEALDGWAWRLPFLMGFFIGGLALYIRREVDETPAFKELEQAHDTARFPIVEAMRHYWKSMLAAIGISMLNGICCYIVFVYLTTFLTEEKHVPIKDALEINTISMMVTAPLLILFGWLSDRLGRKPLMIGSSLLFILTTYSLFHMLSPDLKTDLGVQIVFGILLSALSGPSPTFLVELIPARARYTVLSIGYNLSVGIFGGGAPLIATFLIAETGNTMAPST